MGTSWGRWQGQAHALLAMTTGQGQRRGSLLRPAVLPPLNATPPLCCPGLALLTSPSSVSASECMPPVATCRTRTPGRQRTGERMSRLPSPGTHWLYSLPPQAQHWPVSSSASTCHLRVRVAQGEGWEAVQGVRPCSLYLPCNSPSTPPGQ